MGDVSAFMKELKQRFSRWYNEVHDRYGTLWAERFKSVLVEDDSDALRTVAAYIDLNSVRAGLTPDPKDYRYSGYGEAVAGSGKARAGLLSVMGPFVELRTLRDLKQNAVS
jgi:putative transposase